MKYAAFIGNMLSSEFYNLSRGKVFINQVSHSRLKGFDKSTLCLEAFRCVRRMYAAFWEDLLCFASI